MSRLRSGRGARTPAAAAPRAPRTGGVYVATPRSDVYVAMLGIALGAILIGFLLLFLHLSRYEFKLTVSALSPTPTTLLVAASENLGNFPTEHL